MFGLIRLPACPSQKVAVILLSACSTFLILYHTIWASIYNTARCRWGGQSRNWGLVVQSGGIWAGSVRRIHAIRRLVQSQILAPSSHAVPLCWTVSGSPQYLQSGESTSRILCRRSFVGSMSYITTYKFIFTTSFVQHSCKLVHILSQSADGWSYMMRNTRGGLPASAIPRSVQYTLLRNVRGCSSSL